MTSGGHHWRPVHTCSLEGLPYQYWHLVVATEACAAGKPAVCILLECFLVRSRFIHRKRPFCRRTTARLPIDVWVTKVTSSNRSGGGTRVRRKGEGVPSEEVWTGHCVITLDPFVDRQNDKQKQLIILPSRIKKTDKVIFHKDAQTFIHFLLKSSNWLIMYYLRYLKCKCVHMCAVLITYPIIFSSNVPRLISRYTLTTFLWPIRWALSIAWSK